MATAAVRVALITGAGSGLGRALAHHAAGLGLALVLADIDAEALETERRTLEAAGAQVLARRVDVARADEVEDLVAAAIARYGRIHLAFHNAGVGVGGLLWENALADWQWTLGVNLWGVVHGVHALVPRMLAWAADDPAYRGHVVNTASMAGLVSPPLGGVYNASKHAVVALSETLHHDLALVTTQVRCAVLCPYDVPTGIARAARNHPQAAPLTHSQQVAHDLVRKAVDAGKVSAEQVAALAFEAIAANRFYIPSHPQALAAVRQRAEAIVEGAAPDDPFAARPALRAGLVAALARATP